MNNENQTIQDGNYSAKVEGGKVTIYTGKASPEDQKTAAKLMDKIGKKVNDLALLTILKESNIDYKDMELNKKTDKDVQNFVKYIQRLKSERYDRDYIRSQAKKRAAEIKKRYRSNAKEELAKWDKWQDSVIKRFREDKLIANSRFEDPQAELLSRQNFSAKLGAMNNHEFINYINDLTSDTQLSDYELNLLYAKVGDDDRLRTKLKVYEKKTRKAYESLPQWQEVLKLKSFAKNWTKGDIFYYDNQGYGQVFFPDTVILRELKDYTVYDPSQR